MNVIAVGLGNSFCLFLIFCVTDDEELSILRTHFNETCPVVNNDESESTCSSTKDGEYAGQSTFANDLALENDHDHDHDETLNVSSK